MKLHERAEHLTFEDLEDYSGVNVYQVKRILEYFGCDEKYPYIICGARGTGKTLTAMLACKESGKDAVLIKYQDNKTFEVVCLNQQKRFRSIDEIMDDGDIIVLDDVHYIYDDIRFFGLDADYLLTLLEKMVNYAKNGGRVIIISEDIFIKEMGHYLEVNRYGLLFPYLENKALIQYVERMNLMNILSNYGVTDYLLKDFLKRINTNPRGVVRLLSKLGEEWTYECLVSWASHRIEFTNKADVRLCRGSLWKEIIHYYPDDKTKNEIKELLVYDLLKGNVRGINVSSDKETGDSWLCGVKIGEHLILYGSKIWDLYKLDNGYYMHGLLEIALWDELHSDSSYMDEMIIAMYEMEKSGGMLN